MSCMKWTKLDITVMKARYLLKESLLSSVMLSYRWSSLFAVFKNCPWSCYDLKEWQTFPLSILPEESSATARLSYRQPALISFTEGEDERRSSTTTVINRTRLMASVSTCVDITAANFFMESRCIHASHAERRGGENWLMWGYLWTSVRASWLTMSSVGGIAFTRWEIYTITFLSLDSAHLIYLMALAPHLQPASPLPFNMFMWYRRRKRNICFIFKEWNTWINII